MYSWDTVLVHFVSSCMPCLLVALVLRIIISIIILLNSWWNYYALLTFASLASPDFSRLFHCKKECDNLMVFLFSCLPFSLLYSIVRGSCRFVTLAACFPNTCFQYGVWGVHFPPSFTSFVIQYHNNSHGSKSCFFLPWTQFDNTLSVPLDSMYCSNFHELRIVDIIQVIFHKYGIFSSK